ncbi:oxygen-insensitive NAD(P)H nitroreductase [Ideonella sp. B7]|uniref:oxygen-insensitive NAD(P)H nitroreductase n=1 Tax=Ideonella benzenivorans TaxID=2831643 RepID=UPI001CED6909|nr:oxygen-insensitive NAD(P)H nitroreductase [Ideonella benzenivorans]MCA6217091.1 oxygen-insensitive NAD(P)H nitroreductase [Ideonella benzenivorans]
MNLAEIARRRYTTKAFDPSRTIPAETMEQLRTLLRFAPSSVNSQPWHFVIASSEPGKALVAQGTQGNFAYNAPKVMRASHVVVLCARTELGDEHLTAVLNQEDADGRFATPEAKAGQANSRGGYVKLHREIGDTAVWAQKQVYLALGELLLGAAALGLDACPMEGFDPAAVNAALGLNSRGLSAVVLVALGYHAEEDFNAKLPKSRLPAAAVISEI